MMFSPGRENPVAVTEPGNGELTAPKESILRRTGVRKMAGKLGRSYSGWGEYK